MGDEGKFRSFDDLRRARGGKGSEGEKGKAPPGQDRGWSLESDEPLDLGSAPEELAVRSLERVASRPGAFGPMAHGPAPYRDADSEEMQVLHSFR